MSIYCDDMIKIAKAANGYVVEVCVPLKEDPKAKKGGMDGMCCSPSRELEELYMCKDAAEVASVIADLLPKLDGEYTSEAAFAKAFGDAITKDEEGED